MNDIFEQFSDYQEATPVHPSHPNVLLVRWSRTGIGFGELTLRVDEKGLYLDTECSSAETVKSILCGLVDDAFAADRFDWAEDRRAIAQERAE